MKAEFLQPAGTAMESAPLISIIMSYYNAASSLRRSLLSLQLQTYESWELILWDDGSTDGSATIPGEFQDARIRLFGDGTRKGLPTRLNQAVRFARGRYIARMDADDVAFPQRFERQVHHLIKNPQIDLLACSALLLDSASQPLGILNAAESHDLICRRPWHGFAMPHPTWMGKADWFRQHPYDESALKAQDQILLYQTYHNSSFAGLPEILIGYSYPGISAKKTIIGRLNFARVVIVRGSALHKARCIFLHLAAAMVDLMAIISGMESRVISRRLSPATSRTIADWQTVEKQLAKAEQALEWRN